MTARRQRGAALLAGARLAAGFTICAAFQIAGWTIGAVERTKRQVISGPVEKLTVDAGPGEIQVLPSAELSQKIDPSSSRTRHQESSAVVKGVSQGCSWTSVSMKQVSIDADWAKPSR